MIVLTAFIEFWGELIDRSHHVCVRHSNFCGWCFELHYPGSVRSEEV